MDQVRRLTRNSMGQPVIPSIQELVHRPTDWITKGSSGLGDGKRVPWEQPTERGTQWNIHALKCPRVPSLILGVYVSAENLLLHLKCPKHLREIKHRNFQEIAEAIGLGRGCESWAEVWAHPKQVINLPNKYLLTRPFREWGLWNFPHVSVLLLFYFFSGSKPWQKLLKRKGTLNGQLTQELGRLEVPAIRDGPIPGICGRDIGHWRKLTAKWGGMGSEAPRSHPRGPWIRWSRRFL